MSRYQINATIQKSGGMPFTWLRYVDEKMTEDDCRKFFMSQSAEDKKAPARVKILAFSCTPVKN